MMEGSTSKPSGTNGTVTVLRLEDARKVGAEADRVSVLADGKPVMDLRRRMGFELEGFVLRAEVNALVTIPKNAVVVDSTIHKEVVVGENVVLENCTIIAGTIKPGTVLRNHIVYAADKNVEIPFW